MSTKALFNELAGFLTQVGSEKTAAAKKADAAKDPGGYSGSSSHATAGQTGEKANLQSPSEGSRSSENESDVKKTVPINVNQTSGNTGSQDQVQLGQGVKAEETGKGVPSVKGDKEDPGTSTPITTEDGEKYGSYAGKPFNELYKTAGALANTVLAAIGTQAVAPQVQPQKTASQAPAAPAAPVTQPKVIDERVKAAQAGYDLAKLLNQPQASPAQLKQANAKLAADQIMRDAFRAADLVASYEQSYVAAKQAAAKRAADETDSDSSSEGHEKKEKSESSSGSTAEPTEGGGGPPSGGESGGGDSGGSGGGDAGPAASMGGDGGMGGGMGGGGGGDPQAIQTLLMALLEMGITPDMLMQGAQGLPGGGAGGGGMGGVMGGGDMGGMGGPGAGGGGDPMAALGGGGMPPPPPGAGGPPGMPPGMEVAAAVKTNLLKLASAAKSVHAKAVADGSFKFQPAKTAQEQQLRQQIQGCVREILANK
jgi:hypothetical protein